MNEAEQESLLLRQLAALRRRGHSHVQALELAAAGLPFGPLADRVRVALQVLAAGEPGAASQDPLQAPAGTADSLDYSARAIDARLAAEGSLLLARVYLSVAVAGPLVFLTALAAIFGPLLATDPSFWLVVQVLGLIKLVGLPVALLAVVVMGRYIRRLAPGFEKLQRAGALLDAAAVGSDPLFALEDGVEVAYFASRRAAAGVTRAAEELASELVLEAERGLERFRHMAPLVLVVLSVPLLWLVWVGLIAAPSMHLLDMF